MDINLKNVLTISKANNIYAHDAYFLEYTIKRKAEPLTFDNNLKTIADKLNIRALEVSS